MGVDALRVVPEAELAALRERYGVRSLRLFGSALRGALRSDSDLDVLVEFRPDQRTGFFRFMRLQAELTTLLGRQVDLHTPASLSRHFREEVLRTAEVISHDPN